MNGDQDSYRRVGLSASVIQRWSLVLLAIIAAIVGVFIGPVLENIAPPLFSERNLLYISFVVIAAMFLASNVVMQLLVSRNQKQIKELAEHTSALARTVGPRIRIRPYDEASRELRRRTQAADFEILVLSNYKRYDWAKNQPVEFDPSYATDSSRRKEHYQESQAKLSHEKGSQFRFVKIVQIPEGRELSKVFPHDPLYEQDCRFIVGLSNEDPRFANLRVSEVFFQNTFCVIDRSFLYLEFDIRSFLKKHIKPFVMTVDDRDSLVLNDLVHLFDRINAVSTRVDAIPVANKG